MNLVTADPSFNPGADDWVFSFAVQADGKILVGGAFTTLGGQTHNRIGRLNADGTLDPSFNPGASVPSVDFPYLRVYSLAVQADSRILVGGMFRNLNLEMRDQIGRMNASGSLDSSFDPGANSPVYSLVLQADGRILVGGNFNMLGGQTRNYLGRLNSNGTLDTTFNPGAGANDRARLAEARERAFEARAQVAKGIDPIEARQEVEETIPSFVTAAACYIRAHRRGWSNRKHARQWVRTLKTYARPVLGSRAVDEISTEDVLKILRPIWTTRTETAKQVQGRIENVLDFSAARKWRDPFNPARWRGHLDKLLPRPTRVKRVRPQPSMPYTALPAFVAELRGLNSISSLALQFLILTATRTREVLGAECEQQLHNEAGQQGDFPGRAKIQAAHDWYGRFVCFKLHGAAQVFLFDEVRGLLKQSS